MFEEADLVHRDTRADAITDGVLIAVSATWLPPRDLAMSRPSRAIRRDAGAGSALGLTWRRAEISESGNSPWHIFLRIGAL
jgi:hypothetical protein